MSSYYVVKNLIVGAAGTADGGGVATFIFSVRLPFFLFLFFFDDAMRPPFDPSSL